VFNVFTLRKLSTDNGDESREYQNREAARDVMRAEYNAARDQYEDTCISEDDAVCADAESSRYIGWLIYETPDASDTLAQADIALAAAEMALSQYSFELLDSDVCGKYIAETRNLLSMSRMIREVT